MSKTSAIILAGGSGVRFGGEIPKQFISLNGKPIICYSIDTFRKSGLIDTIIVVCHKDWVDFCKPLADIVTVGGDTRNLSTYAGLKVCPRGTELVLTHDAVRPFVDVETIQRVVNKLRYFDAVDTSIPMADTVISVQDTGSITGLPTRSSLRRGQTPQGFSYKAIMDAYNISLVNDKQNPNRFTDDIGLMHTYGYNCVTVEGSEWNIKITTPTDLFVAERMLQFRDAQEITPDVFGKRILVFGSNGGIGTSLVQQLKERGAIVYTPSHEMVDLSNEKLPRLLYTLDLDCIVNCAGVIYRGLDKYEEIFTTNFRSALSIVDLAMVTMMDGGNIVFLGSSSAMRGRKDFPLYSASKAALNNFTEAIAEYLQDKNIRVNCINPARTNTPMTDYLGVTGPSGLSADNVARIIMGYCNTPLTGQIVNIRKNVNEL